MRSVGRLSVLALLWAASAACSSSAGEATDDDDPPPLVQCELDRDCVAAGASCCECPSFALPGDSGWAESCEDVHCDAPAQCPAVDAVCEAGACALRCRPLECAEVCPGGFAGDAHGCLTCECLAPPSAPSCVEDADCLRVPADCCGCARGGADTAVPATERDGYLDGLGCEADPACPGVDVCAPGLVAVCVSGACELASIGAGGFGPDAGTGAAPDPGETRCGTPDLPPCPAGQVCVLNDPEADDATDAGVGVCRPA